jgi:hypothetical protein
MAHLINHSCAPVAHSRMITVRHPDTNQLVDHVIIVASRNLQPGETCGQDGAGPHCREGEALAAV